MYIFRPMNLEEKLSKMLLGTIFFQQEITMGRDGLSYLSDVCLT